MTAGWHSQWPRYGTRLCESGRSVLYTNCLRKGFIPISHIIIEADTMDEAIAVTSKHAAANYFLPYRATVGMGGGLRWSLKSRSSLTLGSDLIPSNSAQE